MFGIAPSERLPAFSIAEDILVYGALITGKKNHSTATDNHYVTNIFLTAMKNLQ